ncbi:SCP-2 sterol transfer family protein [Haloactinospora alba]|uniref:SCP-2 sterol transfer family protein n=1 Tax=Haloactinospora alba TaxID=405555 RepID=A0A543NHR9_9ACTN|nr:SCP2 sterol-binding domain-containing protein [Haloactinospora alba]TQN31300.1 SCP-2 sterol transfer family protein [Haloactinospora alba]
MTSIEECEAAIRNLSSRVAELDEHSRRKHLVERSISVAVPDLEVVFDMRLTSQGISEATTRDAEVSSPPAQVRITVSSTDLVALSEERLDPRKAVLTGRVRLDASFTDLMRMRKLI